MSRLFVAGYPRDAAKADLLALFANFGVIEDDVTFPRDRRSRRKKGYAYVEVRDERAATAAMEAFNGFEIGGKPLTVCRAEERPPKKQRRR